MALTTSGTVLLRVPKFGTIKVVAKRGGKVEITAAAACRITDKEGRPLFQRREPKVPPA